jgi:hypothetical protein
VPAATYIFVNCINFANLILKLTIYVVPSRGVGDNKIMNVLFRLSVICLVVMSGALTLIACAKTSPVEITIAPIGPATSTPQNTVLTLDEAEKQLNEKRFLNVASILDASNLAGFQVASPSFLPEGFKAGKPSVMLQPGGSSEAAKSVQQSFALESETGTMFTLIQGLESLGSLSGSQPTTISGKSAQRLMISSSPPNRLVFAWSDGKRFYQLGGTLTGTLNEATFAKIAASVGVPQS